jgi:hypothetical protein
MAQTMEYRVDMVSLAPKFPIETFGDGYGDCDDKTLLAAALLSRAGYDVAIMFFEPEKHVALGIKAPGLDYEGTGYAYVEMTSPSLVGVAPETLSGDIELSSKPEVVKIGSGTLAFEAGKQISEIERMHDEVRSAQKAINDEINEKNRALEARRGDVEAAKQAAQSADPASAGAAIARYNQMVTEFNAEVAVVNGLVASYNTLVDADRYANENATARPQVYERLRAVAP